MSCSVEPTLSQMDRSCFISAGLGRQGMAVGGKLQPEHMPAAVGWASTPTDQAAQESNAAAVRVPLEAEERPQVKFRAVLGHAALPGDGVPQQGGAGLAGGALVVADQ